MLLGENASLRVNAPPPTEIKHKANNEMNGEEITDATWPSNPNNDNCDEVNIIKLLTGTPQDVKTR